VTRPCIGRDRGRRLLPPADAEDLPPCTSCARSPGCLSVCVADNGCRRLGDHKARALAGALIFPLASSSRQALPFRPPRRSCRRLCSPALRTCCAGGRRGPAVVNITGDRRDQGLDTTGNFPSFPLILLGPQGPFGGDLPVGIEGCRGAPARSGFINRRNGPRRHQRARRSGSREGRPSQIAR